MMDEVSLSSEPIGNDDADGFEVEGDSEMSEFVNQSGEIQGENPLPPVVGMEFESYEDVYYFYNCYAKEQGFDVRVSYTCCRKNKERYRGKLSCSSAGFKRKKETSRARPETRTGCPAMIKTSLMENKRWRIVEVQIDHNHFISKTNRKVCNSNIKVRSGTKRTMQPDQGDNVRIFRTVIIDAEGDSSTVNVDEVDSGNTLPHSSQSNHVNVDAEEDSSTVNLDEVDFGNTLPHSNQLKLKEGDAQAITDFFDRLQLLDPYFFYVVDLNEKGCMHNLFWINGRSRAAYSYFGDVITINTSCLTNKYEVPLVSFIGVNHHGQSVLLGCGLLAEETIESYTWLFRAWVTCMLGCPPQTIITDQCKAVESSIAEAFPRAVHCLCLSRIMQKLPEFECEAIGIELNRAVYNSLKPGEFESAWKDIVQRYGIRDDEWVQTFYEERKRCLPVYLKETFLAGMFPIQQNEGMASYFEGFIKKDTPLKEFLEKYDEASKTHHQLEALSDVESRNLTFSPKSSYEIQLSKIYTNNILRRFGKEVESMYSCYSTQLTTDGPVITYRVKEKTDLGNHHQTDTRDFEVLYNASEKEVVCVCGLFNLRGYLCRHALRVLHLNGIDEIPPQYILTRWRKDVKRKYVLNQSSGGIDVNNTLHRYEHLYRRIVQVVEEGTKSDDRCKTALEGLEEILGKLGLVEGSSTASVRK